MRSFFKKFMTFTLSLIFVLFFVSFDCALGATKRSKNIFFDDGCKVPLAMAIALNHSKDENDILVFDRNLERINKLKKVFNHVYLKYDAKSYKEFMRKKDSYDGFFTCNFYHRRDNYLNYLNSNKKYCHFEDGVYEYYKEKAFNWWCNKNGTKKMFLLFPQYRFEAFKSLPTEAVSKEKYLKAIEILYNPKPIKDKILYAMDCPEFLNECFTKQMVDILKEYDNVAVKCHPRDGIDHNLPSEFTVLDKSKPFESFYYGFNGIFISNISSCLHTAKFMQPNSTVICTIFLDESKSPKEYQKYIEMLEKLGVLFPKSVHELKSMISQNINKFRSV